jgi:hypothetical protein
MKNLLKTELRKALKNKFFIFSVLLGMFFVIISAFYVLRVYYSELGTIGIINQIKEKGIQQNPIIEGTTLYNSWIGGEGLSLGYTLFFTLLPVLAMLPCGLAISEELRGGYLHVIVPKCGRKNYFLSKIISAFVAGGLAVTIPLVFSLLLISLFIPAITPNVIYFMYYPISHGDFLSGIIYTYPMLFTALYLCIDFVFSGLIACLSISAAFLFKHRAAPIVVPFLFIIGSDMARAFLYYICYVQISPLILLHAIPMAGSSKAPVMLAWLLIFFFMTVPFIMIRGCKREIS